MDITNTDFSHTNVMLDIVRCLIHWSVLYLASLFPSILEDPAFNSDRRHE